MDKLFAMKVFTRVVDSGSFVKAADMLQLPPPNVSRVVQALEQDLGVKPLNRTTRRVGLTEDGAQYYARCVTILGDIEEMEGSLSSATLSPKGKIKINMPTSLGKDIVIPALAGFYAAYPEIEIEMGLTDREVDIVEEGVDCVLRAGVLADSGLIARQVGSIAIAAAGSPDYLKKYGVPRTLDDLRDHVGVNYVSASTGRVRAWDFMVGEQPLSILMKSMIAVNDAGSYVNCGVAGLGLIKGPAYLMKPYLDSGALEEVLRSYRSVPRPLSILYAPNRHLTRKVRIFIDWLAELFKKNPALQGGD